MSAESLSERLAREVKEVEALRASAGEAAAPTDEPTSPPRTPRKRRSTAPAPEPATEPAIDPPVRRSRPRRVWPD